jgi:hypothetical protein
MNINNSFIQKSSIVCMELPLPNVVTAPSLAQLSKDSEQSNASSTSDHQSAK